MSKAAKTIHFFKAHSRLGMVNVAWRGEDLNLGVEYGPDAILSEEFLDTFSPSPAVSRYTFPLPENINKKDYEKVVAQTSGELADMINDLLTDNEMQVVVGGDHSVALGSVTAVLRKHNPVTTGYIQFDSHADLCTFRLSPTGNFHGMFSRAILDTAFDGQAINALLPKKISPRNVVYIGNLDVANEENVVDEEKKFLKENNIATINRQQILKQNEAVIEQLGQFVNRYKHIHISFDIDVFDRSIAQATGTPPITGFFEADIWPLLEVISKHPNRSVDLVEVNPEKSGAQATIKLAQKVIKQLTR